MDIRLLVVALAACVNGPQPLMGEAGEQGDPGPMGAQGSAGPAGTTGQFIQEALGTAQLQVSTATSVFTLVPGLAVTVNVPVGGVTVVQTEGGIQCTALGDAFGAVDVAIFVDGQSTAMRRIVAANTAGLAQMIANWSFGRSFTLTPGAHAIDVRVINAEPTGSLTNVSSAAAPQLQGALRVSTIKQ